MMLAISTKQTEATTSASCGTSTRPQRARAYRAEFLRAAELTRNERERDVPAPESSRGCGLRVASFVKPRGWSRRETAGAGDGRAAHRFG